jgi:hypothetical protein
MSGVDNQIPGSIFAAPDHQESTADRFIDPHTYCRLRFSPVLATGYLLALLREHFGDPLSIVEPVLQGYVWRNDSSSSILIEPSSHEVFTKMQQRPAILIKRGAIKFERMGLDDKIMEQGGVRGGTNYIVAMHGSHTVFCISSKAAHTELLANEVAMYLLQAAPTIRYGLCFDKDFKLEEIGELKTVQGVGGQYVIPVNFSFIGTHSWRINSSAPVIRHVDVNVLLTT